MIKNPDKYLIVEGGFGKFDRKNEKLFSSENNSYYWLRFDGFKKIISMNSYEHLESEKKRNEKKYVFY